MTEPPITLRAVHDSGAGNLPPTRVVIHATCPNVPGAPPLAASAPGSAHGTALYFQQQAAGGSAHYVCGVDGEEHCVPDNVTAWHAPPNSNSLGIEITAEGGDYPRNYTRDQWLSPQVWPAVQRAAARCRDLCDRYGIPLVRLSVADLLAGKHGICGHVDVSRAWNQSSHSDPGPNFPWPEFMQLVTQGADDMPYTPDQLSAIVQAAVRGVPVHNGVTNADEPMGTTVGYMEQRIVDRVTKALAALPAPSNSNVGTLDVNALATALANNPDAINKLGNAIAAALSTRLGNG